MSSESFHGKMTPDEKIAISNRVSQLEIITKSMEIAGIVSISKENSLMWRIKFEDGSEIKYGIM